MRKSYPSDISRKQFEQILPQWEAFRKTTRPREVDLYEVFCGVLYVLKSGCQWRMLPGDFAPLAKRLRVLSNLAPAAALQEVKVSGKNS